MRRAVSIPTLFLTLLSPLLLHAQQPEAPPVMPTQTATHIDAPLNPALPTVFIVGDSTARNNADLGWGDHFAHLFDTSRINIANRAVAGRSSRTYFNEGRWDKVLAELKPGDFVLLQMGHNDGGSSAANIGNDAKSRGSIKGIGDESADLPIKTPYTSGPLAGKTIETVHTYGWYIRKYIAEARAKGATPILLTVTIRNIWTTGPDGKPHIERDMGFRDFDLQLGAAEHVPVVDMATVAADKFEALGPTQTALLFPIDHTHTSATGAEMNAESVAQALRIAHSPLAAYLLTGPVTAQTASPAAFDVATINPIQPDAKSGRYITMEGTHRFIAKAYTLRLLIAAAYDLNSKTISGGPGWVDSDHFDILAITPGETRPTRDEQMAMLRALLVDRFNLTFHREPKDSSIYELQLAPNVPKSDPKLKPSTAAPDDPAKVISVVYPSRIVLPARNATMHDFVSMMQRAMLDRPVVDKTGLTGRYDFDLEWAPDETQFGGSVPVAPSDSPALPLYPALQQQLGLRLVATRGPVDALIIDRADRPSAN